jgi:hypothetical protein
MSDTSPPYRPRCIYLCCKSMVVYGENFRDDPDFQAGLTDFWCTQTCKGQGPDGDEVSLEVCSNPERSCYREY